MVEDFGEVMAYPGIDNPMYEPLRDLSDEYLLPNLNLIPHNTITLLETNQPFIEAYMVGLNHEFARELLWREYPTDQRGSYFRQFWDVSGARPDPGRRESRPRSRSATSRSCTAGRVSPSSATTTTARSRATTRRRSCW